jgi:hypothetical protein
MNTTYLPLLLTVTRGEARVGLAQLWLYDFDGRSKVGAWRLQGGSVVDLVARERTGRYKVVAGPGSHRVDFWDRDESRPAFVLFNAPVTPGGPGTCQASLGLIMHPRDPAGLQHDLEWAWTPELNLSL